MTHDYSEFATPIGDNSMARLSGLAKLQKEREQRVAELQRQLQEAQDELEQIAGKELPELMQDLRLENFTTSDGITINIKESIHCSIPKARQDEAFEWLEKAGDDGMVKRKFIIAFNRDEEAWANKFRADLAKRKKPVNAIIERKVEPPTLKSYVTKKLEAGEPIPQELFGVHRRKIATVEVK
jgi:hypothetical protein